MVIVDDASPLEINGDTSEVSSILKSFLLDEDCIFRNGNKVHYLFFIYDSGIIFNFYRMWRLYCDYS
ncbi:hypothetical protein BBI01_02045 [Chryseobacterium artocarpi]|uniref:Uncharacterized protein n=1 Tax=Chryseobacterium artocarpi TaxID=1414727 RepID=A0A1B9A096_9FLAO|nr:hypothetical protein BBI01_02045 [Chryseobacterium artocarpi]